MTKSGKSPTITNDPTHPSAMTNQEPSSANTYDYIIVGAGSAGCVLANRLSADPAVRVCLLEAGGSDSSERVQIPAGTITLYTSPTYSWNYFSTPQAALGGRSLHCPRGKVLGGSSSMNSMIYIRGFSSDYNGWKAAGCTGWGWDDVLPYFRRSERNMLGQDPARHGNRGELLVDKPRDPNPVSQRFVQAGTRMGLPRNTDFNGASALGVGLYDVTQKYGRRLSAYRAFVAPVLHRNNLVVLRDTTVESLQIGASQTNSVQVQGVRIQRKESGAQLLRATREVILCAGAIGSPHILLKSGIGPRQQLEAAGIAVHCDLPGVGQNLQDHLDGLVTVRSPSAATLGFSWRALPQLVLAPFRYLFGRKGSLTTNYVEAGGFACTTLASGEPDVQFHFVPGYRSHRGRLFEWGHGYAIHTCVLRPHSRGELRLNAQGALELDYNFLSAPQDMQVLMEGLRLARSILADSAFGDIRGKEMLPGAGVQTDAQLRDYIRDYAATVFHPAGTCKMGVDAMAVVAPDLRVHGVAGLRVADASIMPTLVSGNTNAPCIMIGEKAADLIKGAQAAVRTTD